MAFSNRKNFYGSFAKIDHEERTVSGYASTEATDEAGEKILKSGIAEALSDYMKFANIREMHTDSAVGVAEDAFVDETGLYITAKVVDSNAWAKVVAGVYKGFSVGGKVLKRSSTDRSIIEKLRLCEISLVDRPCNPEAVFDVYKASDIDEESMSEENKDTVEKVAEKVSVEAIETVVEETIVEKKVDADVAPAAVLDDTSKEPKSEGAEGAVEDKDEEKHTPEMDPAKDPAVKVETAETAEDPIVKAEAMFAAIEGADKVEVIEEVKKSAAEIEAELRAEIESLKKVLAEKDVAIAASNEQIESLTKAASSKDEEIGAGNDKLAKFAERAVANFEKLTKRLDEKDTQLEAMNKRIEQLALMPAPPKTLGPGAGIAGAVEKSADASGSNHGQVDGPTPSDEDIKKALDAMSEKDRALVLIKAAHQFPRQIAVR